MAAVTSRTEAAKLLLDAGANPNLHAKSNVVTDMLDGGVKLWGETPLHFAAAYGDEEMIRAMLAGGSRQDGDEHSRRDAARVRRSPSTAAKPSEPSEVIARSRANTRSR